MGLYDEVTCKFPLPNLAEDEKHIQEAVFQTKSLDPSMDHYTINEQGRLIFNRVEIEVLPEEERPYYGKKEWDGSPLLQMAGAFKMIPMEDIDMEYHGDIYIYEFIDGKWVEFKVRFTEGSVSKINRIFEEVKKDESESDK